MIIVPPRAVADELLKTDFQKESFAKIVDYFDYARAWALLNGLPRPKNYWHAYVYMTYVNKMGLQMLYAGLSNISLANLAYLTIPMQTLLLRYKTENTKRDALVASSFVMLMGFNDTTRSIYSDVPDRNDTLWASFSLGANLPNVDLPALNSKTEIFPLTSSEDNLTWSWGMKYTNLTALWTTTYLTEENVTDTANPWGLATYDELAFNYTLKIDPVSRLATISQDHVIGRMRSLWIFPFIHYNSTGGYLLGVKTSDETIYQFLQKHNVKMSIVNFQTSIMVDRETYSASNTGQNVTDKEVFVSNSSISTYANDGEKIFDAGFGVKETYALFNYTEDPTESTPYTHSAITRTTRIGGFTRNRNLFNFHREFTKYLPLILVHMYPQLYHRAKETITNMTRADYLFIISYANYSGYRIEHDPVYTVYFSPTATIGPNLGGLVVIAAIACLIIGVAVVLLRRRREKELPESQTVPSAPPPPPTTI